MKEYISSGKFYKLHMPDSYEIEDDGEIVSIYDEENGVGTINISSYEIPESYKFRMETELMEFIASNRNYNSSVKLMNTKIKENDFGCSEFLSNGRYWKYWVKFKYCKGIFITYNCEESDKDVESILICDIIKSIETLK